MLPAIPGYPAVPFVIAFALIIIGSLLAGALVAWPLTKAVRAAGLGFVDRFLGSIFGLFRGIALMLAFVIVAGLTPLPRASWWQHSALVPPLVAAVSAMNPNMPDENKRRNYNTHGAKTHEPSHGDSA
jgi:membrane protein required for colicin V production